MPRTLRLCLTILILATGCNPIAIATPIPTHTTSRTAAPDEFAVYRQSLTAVGQDALARLDRPTRYSLTLDYDAATARLSGSEDVTYFNRQSTPLNEIYFRLFANYPGSEGKIGITRLMVDSVTTAASFEVENTALRVPLAKPLVPNASVNLRLEFTLTIPQKSQTHYADFVTSDSITTMPTVYPLIPAYDANGWHIELPPLYGDLVYANMSLYAVTMTVPSAMTPIASGSTVDKQDNGNGTTMWRMVGAPMRDFDLNVMSQLEKASVVAGETTVNSWYEPSDAASGKKALQVATDALRVFQRRFGTYPYRELDVIETPTLAGGIEYPGVIVIGRRLYKDAQEQDYLEFVLAHEVAHQWWYGIVGNDQVNFPWVDESLTQYSALIYYEDLRGAGARQAILRNTFQDMYNRAKSEGLDAAVNQPVSAFTDSDYTAIVYGKGPLFFDAIRTKMGDERFFKFLKTYFERYRYKIASPDDILNVAEEAYGGSLQEEYQQWILSPANK